MTECIAATRTSEHEREPFRHTIDMYITRILVGESAAIRAVRAAIGKVAYAELPVLIQGETGVGKELVAQALHMASRRPGSFVALNICAITESVFESELFGHVKGAFTGAMRDKRGYFAEADRGTLFLDEVGSLSLEGQAKLLRVLETRTFRPIGASTDRPSDFRLLSATNERLSRLTTSGRFRSDLAERLSAVIITVPPLAARLEDIPLLVQHLAALSAANQARRAFSFTPGAIRLLQSYHWPRNVRELRNVIDRALIEVGPVSTRIDVGVLRVVMPHPETGEIDSGVIEVQDRVRLIEVLDQCEWKVERAAKTLAVHPVTIYRWMRRLGVRRPVVLRRGDNGSTQ